jgi:hypothetical protein
MGVVECVTHKLIEPFQVLYEKEGEWIIKVCVAYPDQGSGAFLPPGSGSGMNFFLDPGSGPFFGEIFLYLHYP